MLEISLLCGQHDFVSADKFLNLWGGGTGYGSSHIVASFEWEVHFHRVETFQVINAQAIGIVIGLVTRQELPQSFVSSSTFDEFNTVSYSNRILSISILRFPFIDPWNYIRIGEPVKIAPNSGSSHSEGQARWVFEVLEVQRLGTFKVALDGDVGEWSNGADIPSKQVIVAHLDEDKDHDEIQESG